MSRCALKTAAILASVSVLAACDGGGSSYVAAIPAPPSTPTPTPTPTPPTTPTPTPITTPTSVAVPSVAWTLAGDEAGGYEDFVPNPDRSLSVGYDPAANTYSLSGQLQSILLPSGQAGPEPTNFSYFQTTQPGEFYPDHVSLIVFKDSPSNSRIALSYLSYGLWSKERVFTVGGDGTLTYGTEAAGAFLLGTETSATEMPRSGSATYQGIVDSPDQALRGSTGSLSADFEAGTVSATLSLHAAVAFDGTPVTLDWLLTGTGPIGSGTSHFNGALTGTLDVQGAPPGFQPIPTNATGSFLGGFYGPDASEAGYAFSATTDHPAYINFNAVTGIFVGKR